MPSKACYTFLFSEFVDVECFLAFIGSIAFFLSDSLPQQLF